MSELLPCPFCGGEAEILTAESMHGGNLYGVMCDCCAGRADVYDTEAEAIAAWNTRAQREEIVRCRDCRFSVYNGERCTVWMRTMKVNDYEYMEMPSKVEPDGYCKWGER